MVKQKLKIGEIQKLNPQQSWILDDTNPVLRQQSKDVTNLTAADLDIISKMTNYVDASFLKSHELYGIRPGIAVAAPQLGLLKKIIYIHFSDHETEHRYLLANPEIISKSQMLACLSTGEGCLSVPIDHDGYIARNYKIVVKALDLFTGEQIEISATEWLSVCLQHEIDHLSGILYTDHINKKNPYYLDANWLMIK